MRKIIILCTLTTFIFFTFISCKNKNKKTDPTQNEFVKTGKFDYYGEKQIITNKIMYDVTICNDLLQDRSRENPDWFWENIPETECNTFVATLLNDARNGRLPIYYFELTGDYESFKQVQPEYVQKFMDSVLTYKFQVLDTTTKKGNIIDKEIKLDYRNIKKLRFLEEWFLGDGGFHKRVIAVAPFFEISYPGMETINTIYFWILVNNQEKK